MILEWLQRGRTLPGSVGDGGGITVLEVCAAYKIFARGYYVKNGKPTSEFDCTADALKILTGLYGNHLAVEFGPIGLQAVRQAMIDAGWSRKYINKQCGRIVRAFRWATSRELLPPDVYRALESVDGLREGRTDAHDRAPVMPVEDSVFEATLKQLGPVVAAMIQIQRLTGSRPDEVCAMRPGDIDRSVDVWLYRPLSHKTQHHGRERVIPLGPKAQDALRPDRSYTLGISLKNKSALVLV